MSLGAKFFNKAGYWTIYDNTDAGPVIVYLTDDPINALIKLSGRGHGSVMFCPNNMEVKEAMEWWEKEKVKYNQPLATSSVYRESDERLPKHQRPFRGSP